MTSDIYGYSITVDKWSAGKHRSFFGIVSHKMNTETGIIVKQVLDVSEFEDTATAENIALHVNTVFTVLGLSTDDVVATTSDTEVC